MKSIEKEKICVSCEGRIPLDAEVCPFCATDQNKTGLHNSFKAPLFQNQSLEDSLTSLYTPPYQGKRPQFSEPMSVDSGGETDYEDDMPHYKEVTSTHRDEPILGERQEEEAPKSSLTPTLMLLGGLHFFLLGMMQLLFSKNGILRLEWNANLWFFYCLVGAPLLYFGYKKVKELG